MKIAIAILAGCIGAAVRLLWYIFHPAKHVPGTWECWWCHRNVPLGQYCPCEDATRGMRGKEGPKP